MQPKFIFISGGVISGVGKGITTASISLLLQSRGYRVCPIKCDAYVNVDAGTIRPQEHGEVFVCDDGIETDEDLGHYERFIHHSLSRANYMTTGSIYQEIIRKERAFFYEGEDVEVVPHVPEEMILRFKEAGRKMKADFVLIEIGGTTGEYQNILFLEANRIMKYRHHDNVLHVHVGYLPTPPSLGEMKSKPVQTSVRLLNETGIQPDFIVGRSEKPMDQRRRERIALFTSTAAQDVISNPNVKSIYEVPLVLAKQEMAQKILRKFGLAVRKADGLDRWRKLVENISRLENESKPIQIGIIGKYQKVGDDKLEDAYVSVVEAVKHASWASGRCSQLTWFDSDTLEKDGLDQLAKMDGIIVPQGWGSRGVEGKIRAVKFARENNVPYLGLCFGMQMAVIEFARHVLGLTGANTTEADPATSHPVIHVMPEQQRYLAQKQYGGTIRLGLWDCRILPRTKLSQAYGKTGVIKERHRHRYEFNNSYRTRLEKAGLKISGVSPDNKLVEVIELPQHPFFVATQFHPEYVSRPLTPHPLFLSFIKAAGRFHDQS